MIRMKMFLVLLVFLTGCAGPHTLNFDKTETGCSISTCKNDTDFWGKRKTLPKGVYGITPTEHGVGGAADYKPDYKVLEVVINKNDSL